MFSNATMLISRQVRQDVFSNDPIRFSIKPTEVTIDREILMRMRTGKSLDPYWNPEKQSSKTPSHGS